MDYFDAISWDIMGIVTIFALKKLQLDQGAWNLIHNGEIAWGCICLGHSGFFVDMYIYILCTCM